MQKIMLAFFISVLCSCSFLTLPQVIGLGEDIVDDVVEMETGNELNLGPEHKN